MLGKGHEEVRTISAAILHNMGCAFTTESLLPSFTCRFLLGLERQGLEQRGFRDEDLKSWPMTFAVVASCAPTNMAASSTLDAAHQCDQYQLMR